MQLVSQLCLNAWVGEKRIPAQACGQALTMHRQTLGPAGGGASTLAHFGGDRVAERGFVGQIPVGRHGNPRPHLSQDCPACHAGNGRGCPATTSQVIQVLGPGLVLLLGDLAIQVLRRRGLAVALPLVLRGLHGLHILVAVEAACLAQGLRHLGGDQGQLGVADFFVQSINGRGHERELRQERLAGGLGKQLRVVGQAIQLDGALHQGPLHQHDVQAGAAK